MVHLAAIGWPRSTYLLVAETFAFVSEALLYRFIFERLSWSPPSPPPPSANAARYSSASGCANPDTHARAQHEGPSLSTRCPRPRSPELPAPSAVAQPTPRGPARPQSARPAFWRGPRVLRGFAFCAGSHLWPPRGYSGGRGSKSHRARATPTAAGEPVCARTTGFLRELAVEIDHGGPRTEYENSATAQGALPRSSRIPRNTARTNRVDAPGAAGGCFLSC